MSSPWLRSVSLALGLMAAGIAAAQAPHASVDLAKPGPPVRVSATYTGSQRAPHPAEIQLVLAWIAYRELGRDYAERGLHDRLLEFEDGGQRYWALVAYPANLHVGRLKAGERMELALERIGYSDGRPVVVATYAGDSIGRPIRAAVNRFASGQLRFDYAGRPYDTAMTPAALDPSSLTSYPDAGVSELSLAYGDITHVSARLRLKRLAQPGEYRDYRDFEARLTLQGSTYVSLTPSELGDCVLRLARIDASGVKGTLTCRRSAAASDLMPTALDFSARP